MTIQPTTTINTQLIDSLVQIILTLTDEEKKLLLQQILHPPSAATASAEKLVKDLEEDINLGIEQLESGNFTDYDDESLPQLLKKIQMRGQQRIERGVSQ
jgi:hypothetical protein